MNEAAKEPCLCFLWTDMAAETRKPGQPSCSSILPFDLLHVTTMHRCDNGELRAENRV